MSIYIVTGTDSGIGRSIAEMLLDKGFEVLTSVLNLENSIVHPKAKNFVADFTNAAQMQAFLDFCQQESEKEKLAAVICNAGMIIPGPTEGLTIDQIRKVFEVNVFAAIQLTQVLLPQLRRDKGRVVFIGSVSSRLNAPLMGSYGASKAALRIMADSLRQEVSGFGVSVSVIEPGPIKTAIWDSTQNRGKQLRKKLPESIESVYEPMLDQLESSAQEEQRNAVSPEVVLRTIQKALFHKRPKAHYLAGRAARLQAFAVWLLPPRWIDIIVARTMRKSHQKWARLQKKRNHQKKSDDSCVSGS